MKNEPEHAFTELLRDAHSSEADRFTPHFADRVMSRIEREREQVQLSEIVAALSRQARRLLPALVAASLVLMAWNFQQGHTTAASPIAAALGLPPVTLPTSAASQGGLTNTESFQ